MKISELITEADLALHNESLDLFEMANLHPADTGLNNLVVWVSGGGDKLQHGPRIKVVRGSKWRSDLASTVPLTGIPRIVGNADLTQEEFSELIDWIAKNRSTILSYWNDEISTRQMLDQINKL